MSKITSFNFKNTSSEDYESEEISICAEWTNSKIKILILKNDNSVLVGEVPLTNFDTFAKKFDKTLEDYVQEMQTIFSGDDDSIEFKLNDNKLFWKRKMGKLARGQIKVVPVTETDHLSKFLKLLIQNSSVLKKDNSKLKESNEISTTKCDELSSRLSEIIILKNKTESELYKKFILLLNSKKRKIRELKCKIRDLEKDSIFEASTDESENELQNKKICTKTVNKSDNNQEKLSQACTSIKQLDVHLEEDEETPDFLSDESECPLNLKFNEENITSEEEMF